MKSSYDYGLSKIYELVINANPSYAFLLDTNTLLHNKFVVTNENKPSHRPAKLSEAPSGR